MREISFRGKRVDNGRWAYGYFVETPITTEFNCDGQFLDSGGKGRYCIVQDNCAHEVDPETVGMFTGIKKLTDGIKLYEGDRIKLYWEEVFFEGSVIGEISYDNTYACFMVDFPEKGTSRTLSSIDFDYTFEGIAGTIYDDNHELLGEAGCR